MDFVTRPTRAAFFGITRLEFMGRTNLHCARRQPIARGFAPNQDAVAPTELLHPDLTQGLDRWDAAQQFRRLSLPERGQQEVAIRADLGRQARALAFLAWQTPLGQQRPVAFAPGLR